VSRPLFHDPRLALVTFDDGSGGVIVDDPTGKGSVGLGYDTDGSGAFERGCSRRTIRAC
jgi:hypothetical protein